MALLLHNYVRDNPHVFDMYFCSITSFQYHPANPQATRLTLDECARVAVQMMSVRADVLSDPQLLITPPLSGQHDLEGL